MAEKDIATHMQSRIWLEEAERDNPFAARAAYCHGYDVFGEMLGSASWVEMLYLLFRGEAPARDQAALLEVLAVALANPGPRDASVHAAMCGAVGGSPAASSLMAALAVGAGKSSGAREVWGAMELWQACGMDPRAWAGRLSVPAAEPVNAWPSAGHAPGFDPNGVSVAVPVMQTLARLASFPCAPRCAWLWSARASLEAAAGLPLSMAGVAAAAFADLGCDADEGEMLFLLLRLPGAAAHALEQGRMGHKRFPFYAMQLEKGPREKAA